MRLKLWGTRGSLPSPGPETVRYGGNTSCVELRDGDGPVIVLDAGTGIRRLGVELEGHNGRVDLLLSHLHMDHIQGLGFFRPLYEPDREVHIWGPGSTTLDVRDRLMRYLSPPLFPVRLRDLPCRLSIHNVPLEGFEIGPFRVRAQLICHPGPTVGYRIRNGGGDVTYLPDHEPALGWREFPNDPKWTSGYDLARDSQLLIHDVQYTDDEYASHIGWGHSSVSQAAAFAELADVERLVTFHHDPAHGDALLDRLLESVRACANGTDVIAGTEDLELTIG